MEHKALLDITLAPDQPIAQQLRAQVRALIAMGQLEPATRLPTVNELAGYLRINRNTVASAYQQLEQDGFVESVVGRGTFVADSALVRQERQKRELFDIADQALAKVYGLGFDPQDYIDAVTVAARRGSAAPGKFRALFVECTLGEAQQYAAQIEEHTGVSVVPVELSVFEGDEQHRFRLLRLSDLVITTFYHVQEVRDLVGDAGEVLALGVSMPLKMLMELSHLPAGSSIALVCCDVDERCLQNLRKSILNAGIEHLNIEFVTDLDKRTLAEAAASVERIYACSSTRSLIEQRDGTAKITIPLFIQQLDRGGLDMVREHAERSQQDASKSKME